MAEMWKPLDMLTYINWVDIIIGEASDNLNEWETNFVESIRLQLAAKRTLSQRQAEILERIYAEKTV